MEVKKILLLLTLLTTSIFVVSAQEGTAIIDVNLMSQDPDPVVAGDIVELRFSIENIGSNSYENLIVELEDNYPFTIIGDKTKDLGTLLSGQNDDNKEVVKFTVRVDKDILAGSHTIELNTYNENFKSQKKPFEFEVDVKTKDSAEVTKIDKTILLPGKQDQVTFTITNVGSSNLKDLRFSFVEETDTILAVAGDNSKYIKELKVGESENITYDVIASSSATADLYELALTLSYTDSITGSTEDITTSAGIYIGGETSFDVVFSDQVEQEYSFTIANVGANDATSVKISILENTQTKASSKSSDIIGNLDKGDYTTTTFELSKASSELTLEIEYTDTMGERVTLEKTVEVKSTQVLSEGEDVLEKKTGRGPMGQLANAGTGLADLAMKVGIGIIGIIVLIVGYKYYRRKKSHK